MRWSLPERGEWVAHINARGGNQPDGGRSLLPLNAKQMLEDACQVAGYDDYGDDWFLSPYRVLVDALNNEAELTTVGRLVAHSEIARSLQARLRGERNPPQPRYHRAAGCTDTCGDRPGPYRHQHPA